MAAAAIEVGTAIVGAGFGGIGLALSLAARGDGDFVLLERAATVGGVWRDNTYPGAACDVPSRLYSLSFAPWHGWSRRYAPQAEIRAYLEQLVERHGLAPKLHTGCAIVAARYDDASARWLVEAADGRRWRARALVLATGLLGQPLVPELPGHDRFPGPVFHSAAWRHDVALAGRRVAVIGGGASAVQIVPELVGKVASLALYQRTPSYVIPKPDRAYGARERALIARFPVLATLARLATFIGHEARALGFVSFPALLGLIEWRFHLQLRTAVPDPALRQRLTPPDRIGCRRILISNDWYPALQRPEVEVIAAPIRTLTPRGILADDGKERACDAIVLATGFRASEFLAPIAIEGRDRRRLADAWADGAEAHLGILVHGFPNFYVLYGPNTNLGHNSIVYMLECQIRYVLGCLDLLRRRGARTLEVREDVQRRFNDRLARATQRTVFAQGCRSWYVDARGRHAINWPGYALGYRWRTRAPRLEDLVLR